MLLFGHLGLTVAGGRVVEKLARGKLAPDYRVLLVGAVLPDLVDKPIGYVLMSSSFNNGRLFAHSLLFLAGLTLAGLLADGRARPVLLTLALGTAIHLALDYMWLLPTILLWPLLGWRLPSLPGGTWGDVWLVLQRDPAIYLPEVIGALVLFYFPVRLWRRRAFGAFWRTGTLENATLHDKTRY